MIDFLIQAFVLLLSLFVLMESADSFVDAASSIARRLGISELLISLTLVALGTSLPEVGVSIFGAMGGYPALAVSNILGSVIFNTCVCVGIVALLVEVKVLDWRMIFRDCIMLLASYTLLFFVLGVTGLDQAWGWIFILLYLFYIILLYRDRKHNKLQPIGRHRKRDWLVAFACIIGIWIGAKFSVDSAIALGAMFSIPEWIMGATVLAVGTSLPELIVSLTALRKKKLTISIGNVIGSNIFDILIGLGATAILAPVVVDFSAMSGDLIILIAATIVLTIALLSKWRIHVKGGIALALIYLLYLVYLIGPSLV